MSTALRKKGSPPAGPPRGPVTARLADCHARIRAHLAEARALASEGGAPEARRASASAVVAYFGRALPLHAEDEDRSIGPLLGAEHRALLARLADDHAEADSCLAGLLPTWERWSAGSVEPADAAHRALVVRLSELLEAHLALEEGELFDAVERLPPEQAARVIAEMRARRA